MFKADFNYLNDQKIENHGCHMCMMPGCHDELGPSRRCHDGSEHVTSYESMKIQTDS